MKIKMLYILSLISLLAMMFGCAIPPKTPVYISDGFAPKDRQRIVLLPLVDNGIDERLNTEPNVEKRVRRFVEERGYEFADLENISYPQELDKRTFDILKFDWVRTLPLNSGDWAMIISIDYLNRFPYELGVGAEAYLTGYLVEYPSGNLIWEGFGYGGMAAGWMLTAFVDDDALNLGIWDLMMQLPPIKEYSSIVLEEPLARGTCTMDCDDPTVESLVCVFFEEDKTVESDENFGVPTDTRKEIHTLYDGTEPIGVIERGQYICWSRMPGKVMLHIEVSFNAGGRPAYFRSKGGREYYLFAKRGSYTDSKKSNIWWLFNEIDTSEREAYLSKYKEVVQVEKPK